MKTVGVLCIFINLVVCRDYYVGMFKVDDLLMASDTVYKERRPHSRAVAEYGRIFSCDITYFRVVDRLGLGNGMTVKITRGGLRKKYVVLRITSSYNLPLSVNVYVGCENKYNFTRSTYIIRPTRATKATKATTQAPKGNGTEPSGEKKPETEDKPEDKPPGGDVKPEEPEKPEGPDQPDEPKPDEPKPDDPAPDDPKPDDPAPEEKRR